MTAAEDEWVFCNATQKSALAGRRLAAPQTLCDRSGVLAAIKYGHDGGDVTLQVVINRERETLGERAMQSTVRLGMNPRE